jgi:endo-1,3(4)-beta-glucanase
LFRLEKPSSKISYELIQVVGIMWATKMDYSTFFGAQTEFIHCIQHIPFRAQSEDLLPASWMSEAFPVLRTSLSRPEPPISTGFKAFVFMAQAIIDPQGAWQNLTIHNWTWNGPHAAMTRTSALWWVATRPN